VVVVQIVNQADPEKMREHHTGGWHTVEGAVEWWVDGKERDFERWGWKVAAWAPIPPESDPRDATIATLRAELERLADSLELAADRLRDESRFIHAGRSFRPRISAARALLARLEGPTTREETP
jgi:hypothetical protein